MREVSNAKHDAADMLNIISAITMSCIELSVVDAAMMSERHAGKRPARSGAHQASDIICPLRSNRRRAKQR